YVEMPSRVQQSSRAILLDHLDEMAHLPELTGELRALRVLSGATDLAQAERPQRAAVLGGLADRATNLPDLDLRHSRSPVVPPVKPLRPAPLPLPPAPL